MQVQLLYIFHQNALEDLKLGSRNMSNLSAETGTAISNDVPLVNDLCSSILPDPEFHKVADRHTTNLVTGVLNAVLSPFGVVGNFAIVLVISRKVSLRTPLNMLLGCLAASDFLVSLVVQPSYVAFRITENVHRFVPCSVRLLYSTGFFICYGVSLTTLCAISCERYLALIFPLKYMHLMRNSRIIKLVIFIWMVNVILTALQWAHNDIARGIHLMSWLVLLITALVSQVRVLPIIRRHQNQIKQLQLRGPSRQRSSSSSQSAMQIKFAANIACIMSVYLAFNLPVLLVTAMHQIILIDINTYNLYSWAETAAFLNSTVNPIICLWRVKAIRSTIRELFHAKENGRKKVFTGYLSFLEIPDSDIALVVYRRHHEPHLVITNSTVFSTKEFSEKS